MPGSTTGKIDLSVVYVVSSLAEEKDLRAELDLVVFADRVCGIPGRAALVLDRDNLLPGYLDEVNLGNDSQRVRGQGSYPCFPTV